MTKIYVPQGVSEARDFQLLDAQTPLPGTGFDIDILWATDPCPLEAVWLDQAAGTVRVTGMGALALGTYQFRFRLTGAGPVVGYVPNGACPDQLIVINPLSPCS